MAFPSISELRNFLVKGQIGFLLKGDALLSTLSIRCRLSDKFESKMPSMKRWKHIFVISVDCGTTSDLMVVVKTVIDAAGRGGSIGFIILTSMTISETHTTLLSRGLKPYDFFAVIYNSRSELYFTSSASEDNTALPYTLNADCHSHIEFRWGGESLRETLIRWISSVEEKKKHETRRGSI